jgi:hypothetical protein
MDKKGRSEPDSGLIYSPYIPDASTPKALDPSDFSVRKGLRTRFFPQEPSAVDQLAALEAPDGEAGQRVAEWKERERKGSLLNKRWKVYTDPLYDKPNPDFFGICTVENL